MQYNVFVHLFGFLFLFFDIQEDVCCTYRNQFFDDDCSFFFNMCYTSICSTFFHDFFSFLQNNVQSQQFCIINNSSSMQDNRYPLDCQKWRNFLQPTLSETVMQPSLKLLLLYTIEMSEITESLRPNCTTFQKRIGYKITICSMFNSPSGDKFNSFWRGREGKFLHMSQNVFMLHHCTHCLLCLVNNLHTLLLEKKNNKNP